MLENWALASVLALGALASFGAPARSQQTPEQLGWNAAALDRAFTYAKSLGTDSFVVVTNGVVVRSLGDLQRPYTVHSVRKALLSTVVGLHLGPGAREIDLGATLQDLGIDDSPGPLTPRQRQATVLHLIKSISAINHPAAAEEGQAEEKNRRLGRGENAPGTIWAYNNWDYNALTTVFETKTGLGVAQAFKTGIADRIGMQDFTLASVSYISQPELSRHRAAMFRMSARDLVRFGQLYLAQGDWRGQQVLPRAWIERIGSDHTATGDGGLRSAHGYLWWIPGPETGLPAGSFWALGLGFQAVFVVPKWWTVIVHQADTSAFLARVSAVAKEQSIGIDAAFEKAISHCLDSANAAFVFCREDRLILRREFDRLMALIVRARAAHER